MSRSLFAIHESVDCCVSENNVSDLVERRFTWQGGKRIYGDFTPIRKALNVAVHLIKRCAGDIQRAKRRVEVKTGNRRNAHFFALSLREHKPIRSKPERVARLRLCRFVLSIIALRGSFERHGHAKRYSFLSFAYLPFLFEPTAIGVEWAGPQVAPNALFERKQSIPEAVVVECGVSFQHSPRLFDRISQYLSPTGMLCVW